MIVLERLSDAIANGDPIVAVVRGSAVNQDGASNGLTAPNGLAQQAVVREALERAGLPPEAVGHVETHGTGTILGDSVELDALAAVFRSGARPPCVLGAAKSAVGHLEGAAGIAGLIKAVLSIQHEALPPIVHFAELNPTVSLAGTPFVVPTALTPWAGEARPYRAGVSSFGWSGTNAHVVLEQAPDVDAAVPSADGRPLLLALSAESSSALPGMAAAYAERVAAAGDAELTDIVHTAALRRTHHRHRVAVVGRTGSELVERLRHAPGAGAYGAATGTHDPDHVPGVVFLFPGQGGQRPGMGVELAAAEPAFADALAACELAIGRHVDWQLRTELARPEVESRLGEIDVVQPALFAVQVALAALWRSRGVEPDAVLGHSMGEVAAAYVAGAIDLDDAARIICVRSRLLRRISGRGAMAVVGLDAEAAGEAIDGEGRSVAVAVAGSPRTTVLSGDPEALERVLGRLRARDVFCRPINVDVASHSPQVDQLLDELEELLAGVSPAAPALPMLSTVTGLPVEGPALRARYWAENLRRPVLFAPAVRRLLETGHGAFIELGPHPVLLQTVEETAHDAGARVAGIPSLERDRDEAEAALEATARAYAAGLSLDWRALVPPGGRHTALPTYAWQRSRYWIDDEGVETTRHTAEPTHPVLGRQLPERAAQPGVRTWETDAVQLVVRDGDAPVLGRLALAAASEILPVGRAVELREVVVEEPLQVAADAIVQTSAEPAHDGCTVTVFSRRDGEDWRKHARARAVSVAADPALLYEVVWRDQPAAPVGSAAGTWLVLADSAGLGDSLSTKLVEAGGRCTVVPAGATLDTLRTACDESAADRSLRGIVDLRPLDAPPAGRLGASSLRGSEEPVLGAAAAAFESLARSPSPGRLWIVTRGAEALDGPGGGLAQASAWGLGRVAAIERPELVGGLVDLDDHTDGDADAAVLLDELLTAANASQVAYRGGERRVPRLVRRQPVAAPARELVVRQDASYLLTGGLGAIGLAFADRLVEHGARHLVLTSRTGLPDALETDSDRARRDAVAALERRGAIVEIVRAESSDEDLVAALFEDFGGARPALAGVVHTAGSLDARPLAEGPPEALRGVLDPKVVGAWLLHEHTAGLPLDFFVLISSGAALWGSQGLGYYAAANHFLDALAHYRRSLGLPATSINLGWWESGAIDEAAGALFAETGLRAMSPGRGLDAVEHLLRDGATQAAVVDVDWDVFLAVYEARGPRPFVSELRGRPEDAAPTGEAWRSAELLEALAPLDEARRREALRDHVRREVAAILGYETPASLDPRAGFFGLGMDSIMTVRLRGRLESALGLPLPPTIAFEYPSAEALADHLLSLVAPAPAEKPSAPTPEEGPGDRSDYTEDELVSLLARKLEEIS
jgi:acyl transferase domain-containing protein/acyl carrier protein